jgi:hypothetical protein
MWRDHKKNGKAEKVADSLRRIASTERRRRRPIPPPPSMDDDAADRLVGYLRYLATRHPRVFARLLNQALIAEYNALNENERQIVLTSEGRFRGPRV